MYYIWDNWLCLWSVSIFSALEILLNVEKAGYNKAIRPMSEIVQELKFRYIFIPYPYFDKIGKDFWII